MDRGVQLGWKTLTLPQPSFATLPRQLWLVLDLLSPEKYAVSPQLIVLLTAEELQNHARVLEVTRGTTASASFAKCACVIGGGLMLYTWLGLFVQNLDTTIKTGMGLTRPKSLICPWYRLLSKLRICCQLLSYLKLVFQGFEASY